MIVVSGGATPHSITKARLPQFETAPFVIAADGGLDAALALGLGVDLVVGDLDSVDREQLTALSPAVGMESAPVDKDQTDMELALRAAIKRGADAIVVIDAARGRIDHFLATTLLYCHRDFRDATIDACVDGARFSVVHSDRPRQLCASPGAVITLLPINGDAHGVCTNGLKYALDGETLFASSPRGVSNVAADETVTVALRAGTLLLIEPEPEISVESK